MGKVRQIWNILSLMRPQLKDASYDQSVGGGGAPSWRFIMPRGWLFPWPGQAKTAEARAKAVMAVSLIVTVVSTVMVWCFVMLCEGETLQLLKSWDLDGRDGLVRRRDWREVTELES